MAPTLAIIGSGFAGMWAALSAARARSMAGGGDAALDIVVVSPDAALVIRPRLYEMAFAEIAPRLEPVFETAGVRHIAGRVEHIDTNGRTIAFQSPGGDRASLTYDRLVLAAGSNLVLPDVPGLTEHAFDIDQFDGAKALDRHLRGLARRPQDPARDTVVIVGGGFTGIELATDMRARLQSIFGTDAEVRVVLLEAAADIGPDLGPGPRPVIEEALRACGVEVRTGTAVTAIDATGVTTEGGERVEGATVIWTAGMQASALTRQVPGRHDRSGRLHVTKELQVEGVDGVFATGDTAFAETDDAGNHAMMSCQHAMALGRSAGHNAAADLLGLDKAPYRQVKYVTCLDLGAWGAVYTEGWDRQVKMKGAEAKALKRSINTQWIYPPDGDRAAVFAAADPARLVVA